MSKIIKLGNVYNEGSQSGSVYSTSGIFACLMVCTYGYDMGNILIYENERD